MDMIKLIGLWKGKDKNGNEYLSGNFNAVTRLMILSNTNKKGDKDPDYFLYIGSKEKADNGEGELSRRERVRLSTQRVVDFSVNNYVYQGSIENISACGAFIKTRGRFSEGQDISMIIESPGKKRAGIITRVTPRGIGVKFNYPGYTR